MNASKRLSNPLPRTHWLTLRKGAARAYFGAWVARWNHRGRLPR